MKRRYLLVLIAIALLPVGRLVARTIAGAADEPAAASPARAGTLARARVFLPPSAPARRPFVLPQEAVVSCAYVAKPNHGTTPKFDCRLENGVVLKVKYGQNPEIPADVGATRLLSLLGFAADEMSVVRRVRCFGCPPSPFRLKQIAEWFLIDSLVDRLGSPREAREFEWAAVEKKFDAQPIEDASDGWQWAELAQVDPSKGGASRAELDALRLVAVLLADWDNKSENQRLVCLDRPADSEDTSPCPTPLLMLQDLGATFGPPKLNLDKWQAAPIWSDPAACVTSMATLPYHGATFVPVQISEAGRLLLSERLRALSETQLAGIFAASRFPDPASGRASGEVTPWVRAFQEKVRLIADRPACPSFP
jgi:hypothetical protein